ncbi:maleylpyruvate isomerase family mycothiol-dependent enzyme [Nocardia aurea]|uniref:Maleylpyruvate isomerase family mycothiol-dependent enzyme n=1 Tax=Nocardia aurea TaxID=2144174 RepID=A0ABV3FYL1_9NOCA
MNREEHWQVIEQQRHAVADLLDGLEHADRDRASLCAGWRIRDVAAHIALAPQPPGPMGMLKEGLRAGGRFHRLNHDMAVRHAERPGADLVAELRAHAASRVVPLVTDYRNILFDTIVHGQDIAIPVGHTLAVPLDAAVTAASRVWTMGWPFWAKRRWRGFRLTATDAEWSVGHGAEITGDITDLLLLITGRSVVLPRLAGPGAGELAAR